MIRIENVIEKQQPNFWNNCLFHPTDAVEDPWGKKIIDRFAKDKSIDTIRIYAMLEDIVYEDEDGNLAYDFRINDLRLDYLVEKGFNLLIAYGMMPECIATDKNATSCVSKNKTRYKGKLINTSPPKDYKLWEDICYEYTSHIIERYGIDTVSKWKLQCFNEPDIGFFFMSDLPDSEYKPRLEAYIKLYEAFVSGVTRASDEVCLGGPALAENLEFFDGFLRYLRDAGTRLDFISIHNYSDTHPENLNNENCGFSVDRWMNRQQLRYDIMDKYGFGDTELITDEWGMASHGFYNVEECPAFLAREAEIFSAYFVRLIYKLLEDGRNISKLMICLSGQHEMVTDFSGFRNFFTLNFFAKPIYNAYILASKLHTGLLRYTQDNPNLCVIPTRDGEKYAVLATYCDDKFTEELPQITETFDFGSCAEGKAVEIYCIDKSTTNPYRLYQRLGISHIGDEEIKLLRQEGNLVAVQKYKYDANKKISLTMTANSTFLITVG